MSVITKPEEEVEEVVVLDELDEIILKAENYIREHGWVRGLGWSSEGKVCMLGAIYAAKFGIGSLAQYQSVTHDIIRQANAIHHEIVNRINKKSHQYPNHISSLPFFNDVVAKSVEDIYNILRIAREDS